MNATVFADEKLCSVLLVARRKQTQRLRRFAHNLHKQCGDALQTHTVVSHPLECERVHDAEKQRARAATLRRSNE